MSVETLLSFSAFLAPLPIVGKCLSTSSATVSATLIKPDVENICMQTEEYKWECR